MKNKVVFFVSIIILIALMKAASAADINAKFEPSNGNYDYFMVLFGQSLDEQNIESFSIFVNDKEYTNDIKMSSNGRRYSQIPNQVRENGIMEVYAIINYKDGKTYKTETKKMLNANVFAGPSYLVFAKN